MDEESDNNSDIPDYEVDQASNMIWDDFDRNSDEEGDDVLHDDQVGDVDDSEN